MANKRKTLNDVIYQLLTSVTVTDEGCWIWNGKTFSDGYPRISVGSLGLLNGDQRAHRVSWMIANDSDIPDGMKVCHKCDIPLCVNPGHLWLGTHTDNMIDSVEKGRHRAFIKGLTYNKKSVRIISCLVCGNPSEDRNGKKKFCSDPCKRANQRQVERASRMLLRRNG